MTGYQEILTDPSYTGQLVVMTSPQQGNYGLNSQDGESDGPCAAGFVVREAARRYSSWRGEEGLSDYLERHGIPGIQGVDTRALTRHIRAHGAMRGGLAMAGEDPESLMERILAHPRMEGLDLACGVSTEGTYSYPAEGEERFHVVAHDFGVKTHSPLLLSRMGCRVSVIPATSTAQEIMALNPDGYFISNGPGDPAAVERVSETLLTVAQAGIPVFGICLGHQLISRAFGARTYKLPFGHHGGNHPVKNLDRGTVEITAQNHGFAVEGSSEGDVSGAPDLRVTHVNLYDQTVEGVAHRSLPIRAVQFHPEAAPGPHDSRYLFQDFLELMEERTAAGRT